MPSSHQPGKLRKLYHTLWRFAAKRPASIIVSISLMIFLFLWVEGLIGTYATTVGTILGSVAIAVSSIGKGPDRDKWIFAAAGTILVGACAALDKAGELHALKLKNELEKEI